MKMRTPLGLLGALMLVAVTLRAETYDIDAVHSEVGFKVRHMMVGKTAGKFAKFSGTFVYDAKDPKAWKAQAVIDAASIDTNDEKRDGHLRAPDFFDTAKYPTLEFVSTGVSDWKDGKGKLKGKFTMHGVTKDIVLDLESNGVAGDRAGFTAKTKLDRRDYGIVWNKDLDKGGVAIGNEVEITLEIEGVLAKPAKKGGK